MQRASSRRKFLADVGRGTLVATIGAGMAVDLGLTPAAALAGGPSESEPSRLTFGAIEPLVSLMQETPLDRLVATLDAQLKSGTELRTLMAAGALANARTFGGEDYVGFHTMMALAPAYHMALELPEDRRALPAFKVLYRNTNRIQESNGRAHEVLHPVELGCCGCEGQSAGEMLREAVRDKDLKRAESTFATITRVSSIDAFNALLYAVGDNTEVHRTVLPYRAWDLLGLIGKEHAHTLLRQSVRYCVKSEREWQHTAEIDRPRTLLPRLLDQYKLIGRPAGTRAADDDWVAHLADTIFNGSPETAAEAAAAALAEGITPDAVGEAITLATNQLVLRDAGRREREVQPGKPLGSVHGDSIGVHACDSANAWRNMARASDGRNAVACLILGAYQAAYDRVNRGGDFTTWQPRPLSEDLAVVRPTDPAALRDELESAIRGNDQNRACAVAQRYGDLQHDPRPLFNLLLRYAVSEDGALHAEKFYRTASEEFAATRPAFRWRHVVALARVTASAYGRTAPGYDEACEKLGVIA